MLLLNSVRPHNFNLVKFSIAVLQHSKHSLSMSAQTTRASTRTDTNCTAGELIDLTAFPIVYRPENIQLHQIFRKHDYKLRMAGGAVRDILLGIEPKDIDFATDATPTQMLQMFAQEEIRTLNRNGETHGTVTVRINDKFDSSPADLDTTPVFGRLYDYFNGRADLQRRHIRFVGDPVDRIREDYLRILRYFRFHGRLVEPSDRDTHERETLKAITANSQGLANVAGERCWVELKSILLYPSTPSLMRQMTECGVLAHLGFPDHPNLVELDAVWKRGILKHNPDSSTCLAALLWNVEQIIDLHDRLKFSNFELLHLHYIITHREMCQSLSRDKMLDHFKHEFLLSKEAQNKIKPVLTQMLYYLGVDDEILSAWTSWEPPKFPISGLELQSKWLVQPRSMGSYLSILRRQWAESDCQKSVEDLLCETNRLAVETELSNMKAASPVKKKKPRR